MIVGSSENVAVSTSALLMSWVGAAESIVCKRTARTSSDSGASALGFGVKLRSAWRLGAEARWSVGVVLGMMPALKSWGSASVGELYRAARQALRSASANVGTFRSATGRVARLAARFDLDRNILDALLMRCEPQVGKLFRQVKNMGRSRTAH